MLGRLVIALALLAGPASAETATVEKFGLRCSGKDQRGKSSERHFSVDLTQSKFCQVEACRIWQGPVEASPTSLTLRYVLKGAGELPSYEMVATVSQTSGDYTYAVNGRTILTGRCVRDDFTPIPEGVF